MGIYINEPIHRWASSQKTLFICMGTYIHEPISPGGQIFLTHRRGGDKQFYTEGGDKHFYTKGGEKHFSPWGGLFLTERGWERGQNFRWGGGRCEQSENLCDRSEQALCRS